MFFSPDKSQKIVDYPVNVYIDEECLAADCPDEFYVPIPPDWVCEADAVHALLYNALADRNLLCASS